MSDTSAEREKTKRTLIIAVATTVVAVIAMVFFFNNIGNRAGSLKVSDKGLEVTLDEPIPQQLGADQRSVTAFGDSISFTTGSIPDSALKQLPSAPQEGGFSGSNFIDTTAGFVLPSDRPSSWTITDSADAKTFSGIDGSSIRVSSQKGARQTDAARAVHKLLDSLSRAGINATSHTDTSASSILVWYREPRTQNVVCVKYVVAGTQLYTVKAVAPDGLAAKSLVRSVSSFTPIEKTTSKNAQGIPRRQR